MMQLLTAKPLIWCRSILPEESVSKNKVRWTITPDIFSAVNAESGCICSGWKTIKPENNAFQYAGFQRRTTDSTAHYIWENALDQIVLHNLKTISAYAKEQPEEFYAMAMQNGEAEAKRFYKTAEREKVQIEKRIKELDTSSDACTRIGYTVGLHWLDTMWCLADISRSKQNYCRNWNATRSVSVKWICVRCAYENSWTKRNPIWRYQNWHPNCSG